MQFVHMDLNEFSCVNECPFAPNTIFKCSLSYLFILNHSVMNIPLIFDNSLFLICLTFDLKHGDMRFLFDIGKNKVLDKLGKQ